MKNEELKKNIVLNNDGEEIEVDENGMVLLDGYQLTSYKKLKNCYIKDEYMCNDIEGVIKKEKKTETDICSPISLISIREDGGNGNTHYEFQFLNKRNAVCTEIFKGEKIGSSEMIETLKKKGMSINNASSFNLFINLLIKSNTVIKTNTIYNGIETNFMDPKVGGSRYGFLRTKDGIDFTRYIKKEDLMATYQNIDDCFGKKSGTLESQVKMIEDVANDFKEPKILKLAMAAGQTGNVNMFVNVDAPCILITGPSGCGKSLLKDCVIGQYGENHRTGIGSDRTGDDSKVSRAWIQDHLGTHVYYIDDAQPLINRGIKEGITPSEIIKEISYDTTQSGNGLRCNSDGSPRDNLNLGNCPAIINCEGNQTDTLTDGGSNRVIIIDSELASEENYLKSGNLRKWFEPSTQNYGYIDEEFAGYLTKKYLEDKSQIYENFKEYKEKASEKFSEKISNNVALLLYTLDLMIDAKVLPQIWKKAKDNFDEYFNYLLKFNKYKSSTEEVFKAWIDDAINNCTIAWYNKHMTQQEYDEVRNTAKQIRGKKEIKDGKLWIYISKNNLKQQLEHTAKIMGMTGFVFDLVRLDAMGVLEKNNSDRPFRFRMVNIEREYNKELKTGDESVLKIKVTAPEQKIFEEALKSKSKELLEMTPEEETKYWKSHPVQLD